MTNISYQLYSSREFQPTVDTFSMLASAGYNQVEGYGAVYEDIDWLCSALKEVGLSMPTGHFGLDVLEDEPAHVFEIAEAVGMEAIFCPFLDPTQRPTDAAGWKAIGARLEKIHANVTARNYAFGWHNHAFEFQPNADGSLPIQELFEGGPSLAWEADIAWIARAGVDPIEWLERFNDRILAVHIKDIAPDGDCADEDGWADVGYGTMDWNSLLKAVLKTPAKYFVIEHDKPNDHQRFATRSIASVKAMLGE